MSQSSPDRAGLEPGAPFRDVNRDIGLAGVAHQPGVRRSAFGPSGPPEGEPSEIAQTAQGGTRPIPIPSLGNRVLCVPIKLFWGMIFCQSVLAHERS